MKRQETASTVSIDGSKQEGAVGGTAERASQPSVEHRRGPEGQREGRKPRLALAAVSERTHTLILSGELTHRTAHALETELELVCAEGVRRITLDLRGLEQMDVIGASVIAFRSGLLKRHGVELALIPGSRQVHRALEQAGVPDLPPLEEEDADLAPAAAIGEAGAQAAAADGSGRGWRSATVGVRRWKPQRSSSRVPRP